MASSGWLRSPMEMESGPGTVHVSKGSLCSYTVAGGMHGDLQKSVMKWKG